MAQTERLEARGGRTVFVSSGAVRAFLVVGERKQRLTEGEHPLVIAAEGGGASSSLLLEASVGPGLRWAVSGVTGAVRTASKWGEPAYLFSGVRDTDPGAFVAVTLSKRTPPEELEHLDSVLSAACHVRVAQQRPAQVPDIGEAMSALGKGLLAALGLGGGGGRHRREQERREQEVEEELRGQRDDTAARAMEGIPAAGGYVERRLPEAGGHGGAGRGAAAGSPGVAMGVRGRDEAERRLAALKEELAGQGAPPSAPDVRAWPQDAAPRPAGLLGPQSLERGERQERPQPQRWETHAPGTLIDPFGGGGGGGGGTRRAPAPQSAGAASSGGWDGESSEPQWGRPGALQQETDRDLRHEAQAARQEWERMRLEARDQGRLQAQRGGRRPQGGQQQQQEREDLLDALTRVFGSSPAAYGIAMPDL